MLRRQLPTFSSNELHGDFPSQEARLYSHPEVPLKTHLFVHELERDEGKFAIAPT